MKSSLIVSLFVILIFSNIYPQYTHKDKNLVKTAFTKEFDHSIIGSYLNSGSTQKVKAALLTIAQSEDTLWVPEILNTDFNAYSGEICFALGELGACNKSAQYLLGKITGNGLTDKQKHDVLTAIGKTGSISSFNSLTEYYNSSPAKGFPGISISMYDFVNRNIVKKDVVSPILGNEFLQHRSPSVQNFEVLFALYRTSFPDSLSRLLRDEFDLLYTAGNKGEYYSNAALPYLIGCLRKSAHFRDDAELFNKLLTIKSYHAKVEAVHLLAGYNYKNAGELNKYLSLLDDPNPNIVRTAANYIKEIKLTDELKNNLKSSIIKRFNNHKSDSLNRDELFTSFIKLFPGSFTDVFRDYNSIVSKNCIYNACAEFDTSKEALEYLIDNFGNETNKNKIDILQSLTVFLGRFDKNSSLIKTIFNSLKSDFAPLISIAADGIDSSFIVNNKEELKSILPVQAVKYMNNPDYQEAIMSLANLAQRTDTALYSIILENLSGSKDYSIKKFVFRAAGKPVITLRKTDGNFEVLWKNAFKYKRAEITTSKGTFTIQFLPQFAPVTTGNFIFLTGKNFFKDNPFHRVVPGFVIQGGDPEGTGWGGPGYDITSEFSHLEYEPGIAGMASAGKDTEGSQWFVTTGYFPHLNGRYTIFARLIKGSNVVSHIEQNDKIIRVKLI